MSQLALPLEWPAAEGEGDFVVGEANAHVVRHLHHWSLWPVMATVLVGPRKSGRSLLGRIFVGQSGGMLIDDGERQPEETLFHAWNRAQSTRRPLLIIADDAPGYWKPQLPDLRSRLKASPRLTIAEPDEQLATELIEKLLGARGLAAPPEVLNYLRPRIERSYVAVLRLIDAVDDLSLARRQRLTVPLARLALERIGVIDDSP